MNVTTKSASMLHSRHERKTSAKDNKALKGHDIPYRM